MLALTDQLADLRDMDVDRDVKDTPLNAGVGDKTRVDRNILTASVGTNSGGIAVSSVSSDFGGGSTGLKGNSTAARRLHRRGLERARGDSQRQERQGIAYPRRDRAGLRQEQIRDLRHVQPRAP